MSEIKLTPRGEKVAVISVLLLLAGVVYVLLGLWWDCDLRPNTMTKQCSVAWERPFSNHIPFVSTK